MLNGIIITIECYLYFIGINKHTKETTLVINENNVIIHIPTACLFFLTFSRRITTLPPNALSLAWHITCVSRSVLWFLNTKLKLTEKRKPLTSFTRSVNIQYLQKRQRSVEFNSAFICLLIVITWHNGDFEIALLYVAMNWVF